MSDLADVLKKISAANKSAVQLEHNLQTGAGIKEFLGYVIEIRATTHPGPRDLNPYGRNRAIESICKYLNELAGELDLAHPCKVSYKE